jgi:membrane protein implicated in regulation of membrane protease activity
MGFLGRLIFWDFPRTSWQYNVVVVVILAFIFLTPREFFRDQPKAASIVMLPPQQGSASFLIERKLLDGVDQADLNHRATDLVNKRFKTHAAITHVEPVYDDAEEEITGYMAFTKP